jgi:hypothetical protein
MYYVISLKLAVNFFILLDGILRTLLSVPLMSLLQVGVLSFSVANPDTMNFSTTLRAVYLVSDIKSVQRLTSTTGRSLNPLQLPTKLVNIPSTKTLVHNIKFIEGLLPSP